MLSIVIYNKNRMDFNYLNFSIGYLLGGVTVYYSKNIVLSLIKTYLLTKDYINTVTKNTKTRHDGSDKIKLNETLVNTLLTLKSTYEHIPDELCKHEVTVSKYIKNGDKIVFFSGSNLVMDNPESLMVTCMLRVDGDIDNMKDITDVVNNIILHDNCFVFSDEIYNWINKFVGGDGTNDITIEYMSNDYSMDVLNKGDMLYFDKNNGAIVKIKLI